MIDIFIASVESVIVDVKQIAGTGKYSVAILLRGYRLLELLEEYLVRDEREYTKEYTGVDKEGDATVVEALSGYKKVYEEYGQQLESLLNKDEIKSKVEAYMIPWKRKYDNAQQAYRESIELWETAKRAHKAQEEGGLIERWRTLREVRRLAGFKLERRRTGNFVARTFELMHQAQMAAREAELQLYEHNVGYKCNPDLYKKIYEIVCSSWN